MNIPSSASIKCTEAMICSIMQNFYKTTFKPEDDSSTHSGDAAEDTVVGLWFWCLQGPSLPLGGC